MMKKGESNYLSALNIGGSKGIWAEVRAKVNPHTPLTLLSLDEKCSV